MIKPPTPPLPDFDLAELRGFDPAALDTTQPIARFILLLAAVFNDLKAAWYIVERLRPAGEQVHKQHGDLMWRGQVAGMQIQNTRLVGGLLHELMQVIAEHGDVVDSSEFRALVAGLERRHRSAWNRVQCVARTENGMLNVKGEEARILLLVRNKVAFHYDAKVAAKAYRRFFDDPMQEFRDKALLSDGESMEQTRFYFADAAMEESLRLVTGLPHNALPKTLAAISEDVNMALKFIVTAYIAKVATTSRYRPRA